jgi:putative ABC transport system substrate-binding protein
VLLLAPALLAGAAAAQRRQRLGVLLQDRAPVWSEFRRALATELGRLGWHEGRTLASDWRFADGDPARLPALAQALVGDGATVLLTRGTQATRALQQATRTVPIVTGVGDPIGAGFARTLAEPGGNVTGLSYAHVETATKQLELLRALAPTARQLLATLGARDTAIGNEMLPIVERIAGGLGFEMQRLEIRGVEPLRQALREAQGGLAAGSVAAYVFGAGRLDPKDVALPLLHAGIPAVFGHRAYVDSGGLVSYRLDWPDQTRRTAVQLDKVMRGENPARMPFELPTHSELVINARSARLLGLAISNSLRVRADEVIP